MSDAPPARDALFENAARLKADVADAARLSGRKPENITIVAATKTVPPERINLLPECGIFNMGENRVQELLEKYDYIDKERLTLHFIGKLQTNKVKYIVDKVDMIHSVDSEKLAEEISRRCEKIGKVMKVLIEVNIGREQSKSGVFPEDVLPLAKSMLDMPGLELCGLMAIPPKIDYISVNDPNFAVKSECNTSFPNYFQNVKQLALDISSKLDHNSNVHSGIMRILSMGMSGDYREAILNGADVIRPGRYLFGERQ